MLEILYKSPEDSQFPFFMFHNQLMSSGYSDKNPNLFVYLKIIRIVSGVCEWMIVDRRFEIKAGDYLIFNNIDSRALTKVYEPEVLQIEQAIFLPTSLAPHLSCIDFFYISGKSPVINKASPYYERIDACFCELSAEVRSNLPYRDNLISGYLTNLIALCARSFECCRSESPALTSKSRRSGISEVMQYIAANISRSDLNCETLAKHFGYTKTHFSREFSHYTGMSVARYIRLNRVQNVILLLENREINVLDAALECGFNSSSGFYKTFREITGKMPKECTSIKPV